MIFHRHMRHNWLPERMCNQYNTGMITPLGRDGYRRHPMHLEDTSSLIASHESYDVSAHKYSLMSRD